MAGGGCVFCLEVCTGETRKDHERRNRALTTWTNQRFCKEGDAIFKRFANPLSTPKGNVRNLPIPEEGKGVLYDAQGRQVGTYEHERSPLADIDAKERKEMAKRSTSTPQSTLPIYAYRELDGLAAVVMVGTPEQVQALTTLEPDAIKAFLTGIHQAAAA